MNYLNGLNQVLQTISKLKWWVIALLFIGFMSYIFKDTIKGLLQTPDQVEQSINQSQLINDVLRQMMEEYEADRAYVYRFHNGINYYDGSHKVKSSIDFEVVANGIQPIGLFMQDIPTSLFADQMADIINERVLGISLEETQDKAASAVMVEFGISHAAALPFYDKRNKLVMVIGLDWVNKKEISFIEGRFRIYVDKIGRMLTGQRSEEIANLMNRGSYTVRGDPSNNDVIPDHVMRYEARQKEEVLRVGLCPDYVKNRRTQLLEIIAEID